MKNLKANIQSSNSKDKVQNSKDPTIVDQNRSKSINPPIQKTIQKPAKSKAKKKAKSKAAGIAKRGLDELRLETYFEQKIREETNAPNECVVEKSHSNNFKSEALNQEDSLGLLKFD